MSTYEPSPAQRIVFDWIRNPQGGDGIINAKAGSGKTFTLQKASVLLKGELAVFLAFNQSIAVELRKALDAEAKATAPDPERPAMRAMTIHSLAQQVLLAMRPGRLRIDDEKYLRIIGEFMRQQGREVWVRPGAEEALSKPAAARREDAADGDQDDDTGSDQGNDHGNDFADDAKQRGKDLKNALSPLVIAMNELVSLARLNVTDAGDPAKLRALAEHHAIELPKEDEALVLQAIPEILQRGLATATAGTDGEERLIDFDDMLWVPLALVRTQGATWPEQFRFDWIFVDEAQDLNSAQRAVVLACRGARKSTQNDGNGRILFVGDPNQAIYGFAGADCDSLARIAAQTDATRMKLDVCRRCPRSHLAIARDIIPGIRPLATAEEGEHDHFSSTALAIAKIRDLREAAGDRKPVILVISRVNAPLRSFHEELRKMSIPAKKVGDKDGQRIEALIEEIVTEANGDMRKALQLIKSDTIARYETRLTSREVWTAGVHDVSQLDDGARARIRQSVRTRRADLAQLRTLYFNDSAAVEAERRPPASEAEWHERLQVHLKGRAGEFVQLASIHSAKGLQADHVFILDAGKLPWDARSVRDWQRQQEWHLTYVAYTRAQKGLYTILSRTPRWIVSREMRALLDAFEGAGERERATRPIGPTPLSRARQMRRALDDVATSLECSEGAASIELEQLRNGDARAMVDALRVLDQRGERARALLLAHIAVECAPAAAAVRALCLRLASLGLTTSAAQLARSAAEEAPDDAQWTELAAGLASRDARESADERRLWQRVASDGADAKDFGTLLSALHKSGRDVEYAEAAVEARRRGFVFGRALLRLGKLYERWGKDDDAEAQLKGATASPTYAFEAWRALGNFYRGKGRMNEARDALQQALRRIPDTAKGKAAAEEVAQTLRTLEGERTG